MNTYKDKKGFSLIELVLAIAILGILAGGMAFVVFNITDAVDETLKLNAAARLAQSLNDLNEAQNHGGDYVVIGPFLDITLDESGNWAVAAPSGPGRFPIIVSFVQSYPPFTLEELSTFLHWQEEFEIGNTGVFVAGFWYAEDKHDPGFYIPAPPPGVGQ